MVDLGDLLAFPRCNQDRIWIDTVADAAVYILAYRDKLEDVQNKLSICNKQVKVF